MIPVCIFRNISQIGIVDMYGTVGLNSLAVSCTTGEYMEPNLVYLLHVSLFEIQVSIVSRFELCILPIHDSKLRLIQQVAVSI